MEVGTTGFKNEYVSKERGQNFYLGGGEGKKGGERNKEKNRNVMKSNKVVQKGSIQVISSTKKSIVEVGQCMRNRSLKKTFLM